MAYQRDLIYDLGLHNGDDTAHYLDRGFRVLAIDANPVMVELATRRFADAIAEGRLKILNVGIHSAESTMTFYLSERDVWSSFDPAIASREGTSTTAIEVRTRPLESVFAEEGVPFYLKIDLEGVDQVCVNSLSAIDRDDRPRYVSFEADYDADLAIERLTALGYTRFKVIRQSDHRAALDQYIRPRPSFFRRAVRKLVALLGRRKQIPQFPAGSSGPFGEETDGRWKRAMTAIAEWRRFKTLPASERNWDPWGLWFDVHARLGKRRARRGT